MQQVLDNGLIVRSLSEGYASDRARLPDFYAEINGEDDPPHVQEGLRVWTRDLMDGHPTVTPDDIFVVVDPARDDFMASATLLIPQTWRYEGIPFAVGRPELVATHPDYRGRHLVRALFDAVHARSANLGHSVQAITGIPYFYRQYGYTMAVELENHASLSLAMFPSLPDEKKAAYTLRPGTLEDGPAILAWLDGAARECVLSDKLTMEMIRHEFEARAPGHFSLVNFLVIVDAQEQAVGVVAVMEMLHHPHQLRCAIYAVDDSTSYLATFPDVIRGLKTWAAAHYGEAPTVLTFGPGIHPTLDTLINRSPGGQHKRREYAWYLRVPDAVGFIKLIGPALEARLVGSGANRYTGELRVGFYGLTGIGLQFEAGRLLDVTNISGKDGYDAQFPWHLFWNVVFGHRTLDEIGDILPDVWANQKGAALLEILFPKKRSFVLGYT
jgi:hypothetical protein